MLSRAQRPAAGGSAIGFAAWGRRTGAYNGAKGFLGLGFRIGGFSI